MPTKNTIPWAARKLRLPESQFRRAVKNGEVKTVPFAGLERVPDAEVERIAALLGIQLAEPDEDEVATALKEKPAPKAKPVLQSVKSRAKPKPASRVRRAEEASTSSPQVKGMEA
jgi:hypothetical protein